MSAFLLDSLATFARAFVGAFLLTLAIVSLRALWSFCHGLGAKLESGNRKPDR